MSFMSFHVPLLKHSFLLFQQLFVLSGLLAKKLVVAWVMSWCPGLCHNRAINENLKEHWKKLEMKLDKLDKEIVP